MKYVRLSDLGEFKNGINFKSGQMGRGIPLINVKDITASHRINVNDLDLVEVSINEELIAKDGDIFFVRSSVKLEGIGLTAKLLPSSKKAIHCGFVIRFRPTSSNVDSDYLLYLLRSSKYRERLKNLSGGAAIVNLSQAALKTLEVPLPSLSQQKRIASILSAYDDLIENNRRRIQLLEQAARLIYKEWFVHLRFPGHEHVKIINGVPEGWEKKRLGDILLELESGGRPKGGSVESGVPSIGAENVIGIGRYDFSKEKFVPEEYFANMRKGIVQNRDVVVYKDGANIGRSSYFGDGFPHKKCCVNEHVFILRALPEVGQNYLYFWIERDEVRQSIANLNANTAQPGVSQEKLKILPIIIPERNILKLFNETIEPIVRQIFLLANMNKSLTKARDLLLPRLMNGEIAV